MLTAAVEKQTEVKEVAAVGLRRSRYRASRKGAAAVGRRLRPSASFDSPQPSRELAVSHALGLEYTSPGSCFENRPNHGFSDQNLGKRKPAGINRTGF